MPRKTEGLAGLANNKEDLTDLTSKSEIQFQTPRSAFITKKRKLRQKREQNGVTLFCSNNNYGSTTLPTGDQPDQPTDATQLNKS